MFFWYIRNCQSIDKRETEKFHGNPKVARRVLEGVTEQRELNNKVININ
jgi:hypothetical protein